jgi:hypothetical protein
MFTVIFYSNYTEKWVQMKKFRILENASKYARELYIDTGKMHYIKTKEGQVLDAYKTPVSLE